MKGLTPAQLRTLCYIHSYQKLQYNTPSYQEMAEEFGYKSNNSITEQIRDMQRKGYLLKKPGYARSIIITSSGIEEIEKHA